jgi:hypothetical protein
MKRPALAAARLTCDGSDARRGPSRVREGCRRSAIPGSGGRWRGCVVQSAVAAGVPDGLPEPVGVPDGLPEPAGGP